MLDRRPANYDDATEWFSYFRMTKYLPAISKKYETEIGTAPTADAAKTVMTAYAAAALDILFFVGASAPQSITAELKETFGLHPNNLLTLSVPDIAKLARVEPEKLGEKLAAAGYGISAGGIIESYRQQADNTRRPQTGPKGLH